MHWTTEESDGGDCLVKIAGSITEEADFRPIIAVGKDRSLRLDLSAIEQINSCGVREWIYFVRSLGEVVRSLHLERCSPAIVRQLNMISNFRGSGTITSVMLPYYCEACGHEERRLLPVVSGTSPADIQDSITCSNCGETADFDDLPTAYIAFASH